MKVKKQFLIAMSICIILSILYVVLYSAQGNTTAHLIKLNLSKHETIELYNREHQDTKNVDDYYTDENIFLDTRIDKYVYSFVLSPNSKIFRKNFIYNIYPDFHSLHESIEYAYMNNHGDKFGNLVSTQKITENSIGPVTIMRSMNDEVLSWLLVSFVVVFFVCYVVAIGIRIARFCTDKVQIQVNKTYAYINESQVCIDKFLRNKTSNATTFTPPRDIRIYLPSILSHCFYFSSLNTM